MTEELYNLSKDILTLRTKIDDIRNDIVYPTYLDLKRSFRTDCSIKGLEVFKNIVEDLDKCDSVSKVLNSAYSIILS